MILKQTKYTVKNVFKKRLVEIMKKYLLIILFYFLSALTAMAETEIKIGVLTDLSGLGAYYGNQTRVGAMLAEQEINKEDKNFKIIFEDSGLKPPQALTAMQKLLYFNKVAAVYVDFTPIATAVSPVIKSNKKLMVYSAAARSVALENEYAFKTYLDYQQGCETVAKELKKRGVLKVGLLKANAEYAELCLNGIKNIYPDIVEYSYNRGDLVSSQVLAMKNKNIEVIFNPSYEGDCANSIQAATTINYPVKFVSAEDTFSKDLVAKYKDHLNGSMSFGLKSLPQELKDQAKKLPGGDKLTDYYGTGLAMAHLEQMYQTIKKCGNENITCQLETLKKAEKDNRIGFKGWQNKIAVLKTEIKEFKKDAFYPINTLEK